MIPEWSKEYETLIDCINVTNEHAACDDPEEHLRDAIRAALRERDAAWAKAIIHNEQACCPWCAYQPHRGAGSQSAAYPDCCDHCAPLRALLEEAGK